MHAGGGYGVYVMLVAALLGATTSAIVAGYQGGSGTAGDPYEIATAKELIWLGEHPGDYDKYFILTADIDLDPNLPGGRILDRAVIAPDTHEEYSGFDGPRFAGRFDGNGHTISHLTIAGGTHLGLFGRLASEGRIVNLGIVDANITASGGRAGVLAGVNCGGITASYCTGVVSGHGYVGGLAGVNQRGVVTGCHSSATVSGDGQIGGLVGENSRGMLEANVGGLVGANGGSVLHCHSSGTVNGISNVGGLVGINYDSVLCCHSTSSSSGQDHVGGLAGANGGSIARSYSRGAVAGSEGTVGGLIGGNGRGVFNCYSTSPSTGQECVGALVGHNKGDVMWCYSAGPVGGTAEVGGLVAASEGTVTQCFWDIQSSDQIASAGGTGLTTVQMQSPGVFLAGGWDFVDETENGVDDIWRMAEGVDYPELVVPLAAFSPDPCDVASPIVQSLIEPLVLGWVPGAFARGHDVYLGDDEDRVVTATVQDAGIYRGRQSVEQTTFAPGILDMSRTCYWRIDEVNEADLNSPWVGSVWSFTTADFTIVVIVDDFELYSLDEIDPPIFWVWIDGIEDPNNGGSQVGYWMCPFEEHVIVHGGRKSMPFFYDNDGAAHDRTGVPFYSQCTRTWREPQEWIVDEADTLTLYFRGEPDNNPESLYVEIEDSDGQTKVVMHPDAEAVLATEWERWDIALVNVRASSVNFASVGKMTIGVGDRDHPQRGGSGKIYINDIMVIRRMPQRTSECSGIIFGVR